MQNGDIKETGNHEELMAKNGLYAELYNSRFTMDFFVESGGAVTADDAAGPADTAVQICKDEALRRKMAEAMEKVFAENNRDRIYSLLMNTGCRSHLEGA